MPISPEQVFGLVEETPKTPKSPTAEVLGKYANPLNPCTHVLVAGQTKMDILFIFNNRFILIRVSLNQEHWMQALCTLHHKVPCTHIGSDLFSTTVPPNSMFLGGERKSENMKETFMKSALMEFTSHRNTTQKDS